MSNEPEVSTWYCFKLTHFGQVREGSFTFNLYNSSIPYPDSVDMNRVRGRTEEEVTIELAETVLSIQKPPTPSPPPREPTISSQTRRSEPKLTNESIKNVTSGSIDRQTQGSIRSRKIKVTFPRMEEHL